MAHAEERALYDATTASTTPKGAESDARDDGGYDVVLHKGVCGLGIYFTASTDGAAMVDPHVPFYRLPDGALAPGEGSGCIAPGDRLVAINGKDMRLCAFSMVVEELRQIPKGAVTLRFEVSSTQADQGKSTVDTETESVNAVVADVEKDESKPPSSRWKLFDSRESHRQTTSAMETLLVKMETKLRDMEMELEREKKCRFLAEKKNILYRNALRSVGDENAQLRYQLKRANEDTQQLERFQHKLQLSI
ncbi:hypothetical protein Poli38472_014150 [Pythium oligandrum]|uniref:PDZ domain-containing protein n=1 Tax=Pythium oligandrum TaxID=41045 RepID=A0A8K1FMW0_PYTOL|nr:hypothetical protein Poli38472_014150 [Pythium oligandrum]|eukprot:TMW64033.1 hypothetical protein Poli38472_014150 [Pythium oligandrum]